MRVDRSTEMLHPLLKKNVTLIQQLIKKHNLPFRLFETSRDHTRQQWLLDTGKIKNPVQGQGHLYNLDNDPPLYTISLAYVYYDRNWSWNLRDNTISSWYTLFGNLVLDNCPELTWGGLNRKSADLTLFSLRASVIYDNLDQYPCVLP